MVMVAQLCEYLIESSTLNGLISWYINYNSRKLFKSRENHGGVFNGRVWEALCPLLPKERVNDLAVRTAWGGFSYTLTMIPFL